MENKIERLINIKEKLEGYKKIIEDLSISLAEVSGELTKIFNHEDGEWIGATADQAFMYADLCEREIKTLISQIEEYVGGDKK